MRNDRSRPFGLLTWCWLRIVALAVGLAACGPTLAADPPGPGVPRISDIELVPSRVLSGCPVTVRFHFEDEGADVSRAVAHWSVRLQPSVQDPIASRMRQPPLVDSGTMAITVQPAAFAGKTSGEAQSHVTIVRPGRYLFHIQVADAAGRRSNVLEAALQVDAAWAQPKRTPDC